jgi:hypothetical protein
MKNSSDEKQSISIRLDCETIRKARVIAARRSTSISGLLAHQLEVLVEEEKAYERAKRQALALLGQGFHLGTDIRVNRDKIHEN